MEAIAKLRREIDSVDRVIARLLNERIRLVLKVGEIKRTKGLEVHQPEREEEILREVAKISYEGAIGSTGMRRIFREVIEVSRLIERRHPTHDIFGDRCNWCCAEDKDLEKPCCGLPPSIGF